MLKREGLRLLHPIIVDLVQINFPRRIVDVVFMWRITGPVSSRGVNLDYDESVCWEGRSYQVNDLARNVSPAAQTAGHVVRSDQSRLQPCFRRHSAFRNLAYGLGCECDSVPARQIQCVRESVKSIPAFPDPLSAVPPIGHTGPT